MVPPFFHSVLIFSRLFKRNSPSRDRENVPFFTTPPLQSPVFSLDCRPRVLLPSFPLFDGRWKPFFPTSAKKRRLRKPRRHYFSFRPQYRPSPRHETTTIVLPPPPSFPVHSRSIKQIEIFSFNSSFPSSRIILPFSFGICFSSGCEDFPPPFPGTTRELLTNFLVHSCPFFQNAF